MKGILSVIFAISLLSNSSKKIQHGYFSYILLEKPGHGFS